MKFFPNNSIFLMCFLFFFPSLNVFACRHEIFWIQDFSDLFSEFYFTNLSDRNTLYDDGKPLVFENGRYHYPNTNSRSVPLLNPDPFPAPNSSYFHLGTSGLTCLTDDVRFDGQLYFMPQNSDVNKNQDIHQFEYVNPFSIDPTFRISGSKSGDLNQGTCVQGYIPSSDKTNPKRTCITGGYFSNTSDGTNLYLNIFDNTSNLPLKPNHITIISKADSDYSIYVKKKGDSGAATKVSIPKGATISVPEEPDIVELPRAIDGSEDMGRAHISFDRLCKLQSFDPKTQNYSNDYLAASLLDKFPGRITNDSNSNCIVEIDSKLAWNKLHAKITYLSDTPKNPLCAYYRVEVDPADVAYDPNNTNGFFFELTTSQTTDCDDPMYKRNTSLNQHRFYPNNGVFFDPEKGTVTPLKQSITLELPKATAENSVSVSLKQRYYNIATLTQIPDSQASASLSTSLFLPVKSAELSPAEKDLFVNCLEGVIDSSGNVTFKADPSISFNNPANNFYFPNGTFAVPIYVSLTKNGKYITRDDPVCGSLYDHLAFFIKDTANNYKLISNNMYSNDSPFSVLPQNDVEMKNVQKDEFAGFVKYSSIAVDGVNLATEPAKEATEPAKEATEPAKEATEPAKEATFPKDPPTSAESSLFYFYMRQLQSNEMTKKWNIAAAYLIPGLGSNFQVTSITFSVSKSDTNIPTLVSNESDRTNSITPRQFSFSDKTKMINPNMQRLDYVSGLENFSKQLIPGIFYSSFGGVLSNCNDMAVPTGKMPAVVGEKFSILCADPMVGYMGYDPDFLERINTKAHYIDKLSFNDDYFIKDIGYGSAYGYPAIIRDANRLVVFDKTGTPIRYLLENVKRKEVGTSGHRVHYIVNNDNRAPLFLWDSATQFNLQIPIEHPLKSSVYPPLKNKQAVYLAPDAQLEMSYLAPYGENNRNVRVVGSLNPTLIPEFTFDVNFGFYPTTMKYLSDDGSAGFEADYGTYDRIKLYLPTPQTTNEFNKIYEATHDGKIPKDSNSLEQNLIFSQIGLPMSPHGGFSVFRSLDKNNRYPGYLR